MHKKVNYIILIINYSKTKMRQKVLLFLGFILGFGQLYGQPVKDILLNNNWRTSLDPLQSKEQPMYKLADFVDQNWEKVNIPHNWDDYGGYRRLMHGNLHSNAWYRKKIIVKADADKKIFLFFEGVGSYATVWLNGKNIGQHAGGRTTFTLDASDAIFRNGKENILAVYAEHPADIRDLPWVCGGCSPERGFSEGSQPLGIFRPVHLIISNQIKIAPFGVQAWNDTTVTEKNSTIYLKSELVNYQNKSAQIILINKLLDHSGKEIKTVQSIINIKAKATLIVPQKFSNIHHVNLWSPQNPYLYRIKTEVKSANKLVDVETINYGIRWVKWPKSAEAKDKRFYVNGKPVFINGIAEYEHELGNSHAFTPEEIKSRVSLIQQAGFNAFRDAHQPHHLLYGNLMDEKGILWWTQFSAHVWFDNSAYRENFKVLLREWVKERRNNPSLIMWGLQNESKLPKDFAQECTQIIREMDPTTSSQRLVTTCNGGDGTDWDVPQNWTGTYGGNPATYAEDLKKQVLVGEYGAWRTLGLHTEETFDQIGILSEDRMSQLMEQKVRLADSVKSEISGHFFWLFNSHDNPGRVQGGEGYRETDAIGPVNYKGLFTSWGQPTDVYYMFKSNYAPKSNPMVYIVSHTWPNRWLSPGIKSGLTVYSNCDEVELFNDLNDQSLGKQKKQKIGTHFTWNNVNIKYNVLYAVGYVDGKAMVTDTVVLNHLPKSPNFNQLYSDKNILKANNDYKYLYRVNCGGAAYFDNNQQFWSADINQKNKNTWGSTSWTANYDNMPAYFASQQKIFDPIKNTKDWPLFQSFRYGRDKISYEFPVENGEYLLELYFVEPWLGGGDSDNHQQERLINVAVNDSIYIHNLDIWKEVGSHAALKKTVLVKVKNQKITIHFPRATAGQALISAIAIASKNKQLNVNSESLSVIQTLNNKDKITEWLGLGDLVYTDKNFRFSQLPPKLFNASLLSSLSINNELSFKLNEPADVYLALDTSIGKPLIFNDFENTKSMLQTDEGGGKLYKVYRKRYEKPQIVNLQNGNYIVMAVPVSQLEPAYDLKPSLQFKPETAKYSVEVMLETVNDKPSLTFKNTDNGQIAWDFQTGVADVYSLTLRYSNRTGKVAKVKLELFSLDGTLMRTEFVNLAESLDGKWAYLTTNTGNMINAGTYKLIITAIDANEISISQLLVQ